MTGRSPKPSLRNLIVAGPRLIGLIGLFGLLGFVATAAPAAASASAGLRAQDGDSAPLRYMVAGPGGATARNLYSPKGLPVLRLESGDIVAVFGENADYYQVEVPGGFEVWVHGQFVSTSSQAGVLTIKGSNVNQRPLPSSGVESLPLRPALANGTKVRFLERHDDSKPLVEDWVKVRSGPGTRAWIARSELVPLRPGTNGPSLWAAAAVAARPAVAAGARPDSGAPTAGNLGARPVGAAAPAPSATETGGSAAGGSGQTSRDAIQAFENAERMLSNERASATPDYAGVRAAFEKVLALSPSGTTAELARGRLEQIALYQDALDLQQELESERAEREALAKEHQDAMEQASRRKVDPLAGRFEARGWLERRQVTGTDETVYDLVWGGRVQARIVCNTGRYDLSVFAGHELGVRGTELTPAGTSGAVGQGALPRVLDASQIEVLATP